ncbi:MAG: glutamine amidotransferase [Nocardioides sp.]
MKPFLFLGTRAEDAAADDEYAAVLRYSGLEPQLLHRHRLEASPLGQVDLADWSGLILGGGPFNVSDPEPEKSPLQRRVEAELAELAELVCREDFWFLGACYGIGTLGNRAGGLVDRRYGESVGDVTVRLTAAGQEDQLFGVLSGSFDAFVGHKEAVTRLPDGAALLASSETCPTQAFRLGQRVYATQFHPELDANGLCTRIDVYRDHGYFAPGESARLKAMARRAVVAEPPRLLARFVKLATADD